MKLLRLLLFSILASSAIGSDTLSIGGQAQAHDAVNYPYCQLLRLPKPSSAPAAPVSPSTTLNSGPALPMSAVSPGQCAKASEQTAIPNIVDLLAANTPAREIVNLILTAAKPAKPEELEKIYDDVYNHITISYIEPAYLTKIGFSRYKEKYKGQINTWSELNDALQDVADAVAAGVTDTAGDRWTWYTDPAKILEKELGQGNNPVPFGVGLREDTNGNYVIEHLDLGSTAQIAGFREGDVLLSINSQQLKGLKPIEAQRLTRKNEGDVLRVVSLQDGQNVSQDYTLHAPPADINNPTVELVHSNLAYIKLPSFMISEAMFDRLMDKLLSLDMTVPGGLQGMVLDLRFNGGGLLDLSKQMVRFFASNGVVLHERSRKGLEIVDTTTTIMRRPAIMQEGFSTAQLQAADDLKKLPMVIMINGSSASGAEIVTLLKESRKNTVVVGKRSFGKFEQMFIYPLPNCGELSITSAMYTTPSGKWLQGQGVDPDVEVNQIRGSRDDAQFAAAVNILLKQTALGPASLASFSHKEGSDLEPDQKILPIFAKRPPEGRTANWAEVFSTDQSTIIKDAVTLVSLLVLAAYWWTTRRK